MVPKLVIIKPSGDVITERGRKEISDRGVTAYRSWSMAVFGVLNSKATVLQSIQDKQDSNQTQEEESNTGDNVADTTTENKEETS